jgi:biotin synthesis protein BioG
MKSFWFKKQNTPELLLFFLGWGMDESAIAHLQMPDCDVLALYDYTDMTLIEDLSGYSSITLVAWSMGVMAASILAKDLPVSKSIAINGTQKPVDEKFGIHPKIYQLTLDNFSEKVRDTFFQNMFDNESDYEKFSAPKRDCQNQKTELEVLQKVALSQKDFNFEFDYAIISRRDKIIPYKNQKRFWQTKKIKVVELNSGHYPFFEFSKLEEIINEAL